MGPVVASCDVNAEIPNLTYGITRNGLGMNVPMPVRMEDGASAAGRQDVNLDVRRREATSTADARSPDGEVHQVIEVADLSATKISIRRSEEMIGCATATAPSCTIEFTFTKSACAAPDDPACVTEDVLVLEGSMGDSRMDVRCVCDR